MTDPLTRDEIPPAERLEDGLPQALVDCIRRYGLTHFKIKISGNYDASVQPLGIFLNDSIGNAFENTPGVASGRGPYVCGNGSTLGLTLYETKYQTTNDGKVVGNDISPGYTPGDKVYASVNGLVTNVPHDSYEYNVAGNPAPTLIGIVKVAPDANSALLVIDLRV